MKTLTCHLLALSMLCAGSASAADLRRMPVKAPPPVPPAPVYNWTGCYVGGGGGYGLFDQDVTAVVGGVPVGLSNSNGGRGWFGTVGGGCDYQLYSNIVIGVLGDFDFDSITGDMSLASAGVVGREKLRDSWAVGGRLGWLPFSQQFLAYVSGGYTEARFNAVDFNFAFPPVGPTGDSLARHTYTGWFLGAGYEYALGWFPIQGVFWKSEYRLAEYGRDRVPIVFTGTNVPIGEDIESRKFVQTIRSELIWRFNFGGPVVARY